jgi:hypothetical protein
VDGRDISPERLLRLRLAARALIEWKEPPTTDRYRQVVEDLLKVHPFAARVGFSLDSPAFRHDTRGLVLWFLSETLDDADADPRSEVRYSPAELKKMMRNYRRNRFMRDINDLGLFRDIVSRGGGFRESLGYGLTVLDVIGYIHTRISLVSSSTLETHFINIALVDMIGEGREAKYQVMKGLAGRIVWSAGLSEQQLGIMTFNFLTGTPLSLALSTAVSAAALFIFMWTVGAPGWLFLLSTVILILLLLDTVTLKSFYLLFRRLFVNSIILNPGRDAADEHSEDYDIQNYTQCFMLRCLSEATFLGSVLKDEVFLKTLRVQMGAGAILSLFDYYIPEGVETIIGLLADPELSRATRAAIFEWLCRVDIRPKEEIVQILDARGLPTDLEQLSSLKGGPI